VHPDPTKRTIFIGSDSGLVAIRDDGPGSPVKLWDGGSGSGNKLDASTVQVGKDYLPTETLATGDITLSGAAAAGVTVNSVTANGDGTFDVGLTGTPATVGTITVSIKASANGAPHLADLTNVGTGYPSTMTPAELAALTVTIAGANPGDEGTLAGTVEGDPLNGGGVDPVTGALKLVKFTGIPAVEGNFTVTIQNGPPAGTAADVGVTALQGTMVAQGINVTKAGTAADVGVTALQGKMAAQNLTVSVAATPTTFTSSITTDGAYQAKPVVHVYDDPAATSQVATVDPSKVTLNSNGTVTIDLTTLPAGVSAAGAYTIKTEDGPLYLDPTGTPVGNVGSGYTTVPGFQIIAPNGAVNPGDVTANLTLVGDKLTVTASGTPTQSGNYEVQIADGPLGANASFIDAGTGYDPSETPSATIFDSTSATVGTTSTTNNGDGSLRMDLSTLPVGVATAGNYSVQAPAGTTVATPSSVNVGSGYDASEPAPNVTFTAGPVGSLSVGSRSINPSGSVAISFAGNPSGTAPITVSVDGGATSTTAEGLLNEDLHLWDFSVSDFTSYIHVLSNARAVNGSETSSLNFFQHLLANNMQNLEMANGRIVDADMASELTQLALNKIKTSTAVDMLTKHNKLSSQVDLTVMNLT
jgi:flagellin-like hook-associated protein FlgL